MTDDAWNLADVMVQLRNFRDARDWKRFHRPKELAAAISIEAAELQEIFLWRDAENATDILADEHLSSKAGAEVADVVIYAMLLADTLNLNLAECVRRKIADNERRYPVSKHKGVAMKSSED